MRAFGQQTAAWLRTGRQKDGKGTAKERQEVRGQGQDRTEQTDMNTTDKRDFGQWARTLLAHAGALLLVWVMAPGIATVWAGTGFEATAAAFLIAFVLFVPALFLIHMALRVFWPRKEDNGS